MRLFTLFILLFSLPAIAMEITCPSVDEIKRHQFNSWLPLYVSSEELASNAEVEKFVRDVVSFKVAKWDRRYLESGHCFYVGGGMTHQIMLAHDAWRPGKTGAWSWDKAGLTAECYNHCSFIL